MTNLAGLFLLLIAGFPVKAQLPEAGLAISPLINNFYIYTTYRLIDGMPFPSNSLYVITNVGAVLIDTPWNENQTEPLLDSIWKRHGKKVILCIVTHSHADRTAGLDILNQKGIPTFSSLQTKQLCAEKSEKQPSLYFTRDTSFQIGQLTLQTFYPGEGHTKDNLVIWFPQQKVLYGGCLVKSCQTGNLGNIADANLQEWPNTIKNLIQKFPEARYIIPGHQDWRSKKALKHTLSLLRNFKR
jgi:glyoxylase-like metal-dependent hydrolase (beta-lactamase superfamily II)